MDTYWKIWLQLVFPTYVILLVIMVIVISEYSIRFSRLIAKRNPVATLATVTLILLSYTRTLHTVFAALPFTNLDYPNGSSERVWLPDATIGYITGKHIFLFLAAICILTVGIVYTFLLFLWQWLLQYQGLKLFKWVRYQRLCHFIEPYHAPYLFKHRYWTGLLLFARVALYLVFTLNVSDDPGVNMLAIIIIVCGLIFLKGFFGRIYKNWVVELIEMICFLNIALFSASKLYTLEARRGHTLNAYISGIIELALLLLILLYHVFTEILLKLRRKCIKRQMYNEGINDIYPAIDDDKVDSREPTFSVIDAFHHAENTEEQCRSEVINKDNASTISADNTSPLLN